MSKKLVGAKVKSNGGAFEVTVQMPSGKPFLLKWDEKHNPITVPLQIKYRDDFGKEKVFHENFVKHLLTAGLKIQDGKVVGGERVYPHLELVEEIYQDELPEGLGVPAEVAKPAVSSEPKTQEKKKNEKAV